MGTSCRLASTLLAAIACACITACGDSPKSTTPLSGSIVLSSGFAYREDDGTLIRPNQLASDANPFSLGCNGTGALADITKDAVVSMLDGSGSVIATGKITDDMPTGGPGNTMRCTLDFQIDKAPTGVAGAQIRVGQHPAVALDPDYDHGYAAVNIVQ